MPGLNLDISALKLLGQPVTGTPVAKRNSAPRLSSSAGVTGVPVTRRPGRPKSMNPLDQKVTVTLTSREKALAVLDLKKADCPSVAELIRRRGIVSVDIAGWAEAARESIAALEKNTSKRVDLRREMNRVRHEWDAAKTAGDEAAEIAAVETLEDLWQQYESLGSAWTEKRTERVISRFSFVDREDLSWKAEKLHLSLSDFIRMQVFGYVPGQADAHMSAVARRNFYLAVIDVEQNGWGTRPSLEVCRHCRAPLPHPHGHDAS